MKLPRRTPEQTSLCKGCGLLITERKRKPCPQCGHMNRIITATAVEVPVVVNDRA